MSPTLDGILTHARIDALVDQGAVVAERPLDRAQRQPTTLDLRLGTEALQIRSGFLPRLGVEQQVAGLVEDRLDLRQGAILRRGRVYLVRLLERLALPGDVRGRANPRSSTGRIDVFTRTVVDGHDRFDDIPAGYSGPIWLEIVPRSFDVRVSTGQRLNQVRFLVGQPLLRDSELTERVARDDLVVGAGVGSVDGASLLLGLSLRPDREGEPVGWKARTDTPVIDLEREAAHDPSTWFEPVHADAHGRLCLQPEAFYILASSERLRVPPDLAAEMLAWDVGMGELRTNYAGFFDPGFGWGRQSPAGARAVLEVRAHDVPFTVEHGQPIFRLQFSRTTEPCEVLYQGTYQNQGLALARWFRPPSTAQG